MSGAPAAVLRVSSFSAPAAVLGVSSVFAPAASDQEKLKLAFKVFDFDGDRFLGRSDLYDVPEDAYLLDTDGPDPFPRGSGGGGFGGGGRGGSRCAARARARKAPRLLYIGDDGLEKDDEEQKGGPGETDRGGRQRAQKGSGRSIA